MSILRREFVELRSTFDIVTVRRLARDLAVEQGLSLVDQTKIVTAASELARNTVEYGGGGRVVLETLQCEAKRGVRLTFEDDGPGIADIPRAMTDGFTSGTGMGLGLGGAKRLVNEFEIQSSPGKGTRVMIARWL